MAGGQSSKFLFEIAGHPLALRRWECTRRGSEQEAIDHHSAFSRRSRPVAIAM